MAFDFSVIFYFFHFTVGDTIKNQVQFQLHYHNYPLEFFFALPCLVDTSASFEMEVI